MEIEAKYHVAAGDLDRVAALRQLADYTLHPAPAPELQRNSYYDTADRRLTRARYGLRVRQVGARSLITLKGPATVGSAGLHRRAEHEFPGDNPDPRAWPAGTARELALALIGEAPLALLLTIDTERRILHASRGPARLAEICVDRGLIRAGGREQPITEVEIELLPGGDLSDIAALAAALGATVPLAPEPRSKLQRGMALLDGAGPEHGG